MDSHLPTTYEDVLRAFSIIKPQIKTTDCTFSPKFSDLFGMQVFLKHDYQHYTGSFKERGARNVLLQLNEESKANGVVAASAGNHALGLSYHGKLLNVPVTVCMPTTAPQVKVNKCKELGANVISVGDTFDNAKEFATNYGEKNNLTYVNGYDHPNIIAGQGTVMIEILEQVPDVDAVVVPVGGGGLIAGILLAAKKVNPHIKIIGVESILCATLDSALSSGSPTTTSMSQIYTAADGLCVGKIGTNSFAIIKNLIDKHVVISEDFIPLALLKLVELEHVVVEASATVGLTAAFMGLLSELQGKKVVFLLTGGNIDTNILVRALNTGLYLDKRLVVFTVNTQDRCGALEAITKHLKDTQANIISISDERMSITQSLHKVDITVKAYVATQKMHFELKDMLHREYGEDIVWQEKSIY